ETFTPGERVLGPGEVATIGPAGEVRSERWWRPRPTDEIRDPGEAADAFGAALERALAARAAALPLRGALLSGGLDSRTAVALAARAGAPLATYTYGAPGSRDVRFACTIAGALGLPWRA